MNKSNVILGMGMVIAIILAIIALNRQVRTAPLAGVTAATNFQGGIGFADADLKEGWTRLRMKASDGTNQAQWQNTIQKTIFVDRVIAMKVGTSSSSFVLNMATTTSVSMKNGATTKLINFDLDYARPTTTRAFINSMQFATGTPTFVIDSLMNQGMATTAMASYSVNGTSVRIPYFSVNDYLKQVNGENVIWNHSAVPVAHGEYVSAALSNEGYTPNCDSGRGITVPCTNATSTTRGFDLEIYFHWIATSTFSNP